MNRRSDESRRVKFYGLQDYGTYWQASRAFEVLDQYDPSTPTKSVNELLELYNAMLYVESALFPAQYTSDQRDKYKTVVPLIRKAVATYFNSLNSSNLRNAVIHVDYEYHRDLLEQISQYKVYNRCTAQVMLDSLEEARISLSDLLTHKNLVRAYNAELRDKLLSDPSNAEHLVRKHLEEPGRRVMYLPESLTAEDCRALLNAYVGSPDAHPNVVQLISLAHINASIGLDGKTKLRARRRHQEMMSDLFREDSSFKTGCEMSIVDGQEEPVVKEMDGMVQKLSYSRRWLEAHTDYPTILNNFLYLFDFVDRHMLLTLPAYEADIGTIEGLMLTAGKDSYRTGVNFRLSEQRSFLSIVLYRNFLSGKEIELESVIEWFFSEYIRDEFGAVGFRFMAPSRSSTYLEKCRHLFAEMESVVKQFRLYVENGELDTDLMTIASEQVKYKLIPSLVEGKYAYATRMDEVKNVLHLLFSDQSHLTYLSDALHASNLVQLLANNSVRLDDFADHQKPQVNYLIDLGILQVIDEVVNIANWAQVAVLSDLFHAEAISCFNYPDEALSAIEAMVDRGWLVRTQTLLSTAEASYFNFCLNQAEFSNGPDLRNSYLHGSQVDPSDETTHSHTYIVALKLLIALVIKMNDDFCLEMRLG